MVPAPTPRPRLQATLAAAAALALWLRWHGMLAAGFAGFLCFLAMIAWASPAHYAPVQAVYDFILRVLLTGLTWVALGLVYFGLFAPLRGWRAVARQDPLELRRQPGATSYLRPVRAAPPDFDRQF